MLHAANGDGVLAVFVGEDDGFLVEAADAEDGGLGLGDDGHAELLAEDAGVGEGEGATCDVVGRQLFVASAICEIHDGACDTEETLLLRLLHYGNDQAPLEGYGNADVDVLVVEDRLALCAVLHGGVHDGMLTQRLDGSSGDEGHVGELHAIALFVLALFFLA